ncbi:MAG: ABC transporter ATP-binding protein [Streptosporangiaceae bacterium]|nr:ABC transporter ATP-binding protein [Streptosporangiaceae bacterium]
MTTLPGPLDQAPVTIHPARDAALLEVRGLRVDYGVGASAVHAVRDANLSLYPGEVLGLAGESGSGKSTLAYAITRLLRAPGVITAGSVTYNLPASSAGQGAGNGAGTPGNGNAAFHAGVDLLSASEAQLRGLRWSEIAVVLQSAMHALNPVMTIGTQLTDVLRVHRPDLDRRARAERAAEVLTMVGITADRLRAYPHELSGGMRQRAMIAMALVLEPRIVIMDEPTTALDVVTQREILEELAGLRERLGFAVLFITHDLSLLLEIADSITIMYAGRVVEQASAGDLFRSPRHPYTLGLLGSFPALHGPRVHMTGIPGSPPDLRQPPAGCPFHPRCPYVMDRCSRETPPLMPPARSGAGRRTVACWLQDPATTEPVPAELAVNAVATPSIPAKADEGSAR